MDLIKISNLLVFDSSWQILSINNYCWSYPM